MEWMDKLQKEVMGLNSSGSGEGGENMAPQWGGTIADHARVVKGRGNGAERGGGGEGKGGGGGGGGDAKGQYLHYASFQKLKESGRAHEEAHHHHAEQEGSHRDREGAHHHHIRESLGDEGMRAGGEQAGGQRVQATINASEVAHGDAVAMGERERGKVVAGVGRAADVAALRSQLKQALEDRRVALSERDAMKLALEKKSGKMDKLKKDAKDLKRSISTNVRSGLKQDLGCRV